MRQLKLIWDFRGPVAYKTAEHHEIHLLDYIKTSQINAHKTGVEIMSDLHAITYMVIDEVDMKPIRDILKPHRGQVFSE